MSELPAQTSRSRLRQRQQRRQEQQQTQRENVSRRRLRSFPQLRPRGAFRWPRPHEILAMLQQGVPLLVAIIVVAVITAGFMYFNSLTGGETLARPNALWLGPGWTDDSQSFDEALDTLLARAKRHDIGTLYVWVSALAADNRWLGQDQLPRLRDYLQELRRREDSLILYAWLSVPLTPALGGGNFQDEARAQAILDFSHELVQADRYGFDGVLLNLQPLPTDDEVVLRLLRRVRGLLQAEGALLALAATPDYHPVAADIPAASGIRSGTEWSASFKQEVALLADELVLQAHNSYLEAGVDYSAWLAYQVQVYAQTLHEVSEGARLVVDIPTYDTDAAAVGHSPAVENLTTALRGLENGLAAAGEAAETFSGLAIYRDWETSEAEWAQFYQLWVRTR